MIWGIKESQLLWPGSSRVQRKVTKFSDRKTCPYTWKGREPKYKTRSAKDHGISSSGGKASSQQLLSWSARAWEWRLTNLSVVSAPCKGVSLARCLERNRQLWEREDGLHVLQGLDRSSGCKLCLSTQNNYLISLRALVTQGNLRFSRFLSGYPSLYSVCSLFSLSVS